jgi:beta-fructofuranosidase
MFNKTILAFLFISIGFIAGCARVETQREVDLLQPRGDTIADFESGTLDGWTLVSGDLCPQPVPAARGRVRFHQQGRFFIGTAETPVTNIGDYNDKLVGELHSPPFVIQKPFLSLLVGGGQNPDNLFVALVRKEDGYFICKETGTDSEKMDRRYWELNDYLGDECYLVIMDRARGEWGHINVDDIRFHDSAPEKGPVPRVLAGDFEHVYDPGIGEATPWYINDHCFILDDEGTWHLFGITHEEPARAWDEDHLAHATSKELTRFNWQKQPFALSAIEEPWKEVHLWAPHVIRHEGTYYMFYCAGDLDGTKYKIHLATSKDLYRWTRHPENPVVVDGYHARDPFILREGNRWIMYYTATSDPAGGNHVVVCQTSDDLIHWRDRRIVYTDPSVGKSGGPTESPFVLRRGRNYYLFIGPRGRYANTEVFLSDNPWSWSIDNKVGRFPSHAAEVVRDRDGRWYASHCGWGQGGVFLAPLYWTDGADGDDTSLPTPR